MKLAILLATGFEESEAIITIDLLRRADITVDIISINNHYDVVSSHNITIKCDYIIDNVKLNQYEGIILPGGVQGVNNLKLSSKVIQTIKQFNDEKKYIFAICAAPSILIEQNIIGDLAYVCYPGHQDTNKAKNYIDQPVVVNDTIITAKAMGKTINFALAVIDKLISKEKADKIAEAIYYEVKND